MSNPLLPGRGVCDPHVRVFNGRAYLYATHDAGIEHTDYCMHDWWVWSSENLCDWRHECTLLPEETFLKRPFHSCFATDAIEHHGQYYWYFSCYAGGIGVVTSDSPTGPWRDPLGKLLVPDGLTPTSSYDPGVVIDDDGVPYLVFGVWDYYLARLNDDMISLAEPPRKLELDRCYGPYGEGKTDDKPYLHTYCGRYYLSWGCFYAMAEQIYGPYTYKGSVITPEGVAPEFRSGGALPSVESLQWVQDLTVPGCHFDGIYYDRHGAFFSMHNQWYFIANDMSQPGTSPYFRNSCISYLHYRDNGEMAPMVLNSLGVGAYDATAVIDAACYFKAEGVEKRECPTGGFEIRAIHDGDSLSFPRVQSLQANTALSFRASSAHPHGGVIEVRANDAAGALLGTCKVPFTGGWDTYQTHQCRLANLPGTQDICLVFRGGDGELLRLVSFSFE